MADETPTPAKVVKTVDDLPAIVVKADDLTAGDMIDLEEARSTRALLTWFAAHTNLQFDDMRALRFTELKALGTKVRDALEAANDVPN